MINETVVQILRVGITGFGFLLAFMAYRLLSRLMNSTEQIPTRRFVAVYSFMAFSVILCGIGLIPTIYRGGAKPPSVPVDDPAFWRAIYDKLPPSFIKRYSPGKEHEHVVHNEALERFQGTPGTRGFVDEGLEQLILADHRDADRIAYEGQYSLQIEFTDPGAGFAARPILTRKVRVDYGEEQYIVGLYLPVKPPDSSRELEFHAKAVGGLGVIQLVPAGAGDEAVPVRIGKAVRDGATQE